MMAQGIARFRRSQSRWIANQKEQYRSVTLSPSTWRVLFAAFEAEFPHGGVNGQPITLQHYRNHFHYLDRKAASGEAHLHQHEQLTRCDYESEPVIKSEPPVASPRKPKLLRTKATAAAIAAAELERNGRRKETNKNEARRTAKRKASMEDEYYTAVKHEEDTSGDRLSSVKKLKRDRDRLATELHECQASLKRMKHSAHAWKVKYEELLAGMSTTPVANSTSTSSATSDHNFTFTMNINVDVAQNGEHVRTDRHAVRVSRPCHGISRRR